MESRTVIYMLGGYERFFIFLIFKKRFMSFYKRFERVLRFKSVFEGIEEISEKDLKVF